MIETAKILEILKDAFSALDDALGDFDVPVESDEEEREVAPVQYAARRISELTQILEPDRAAEPRNEAVKGGALCSRCNEKPAYENGVCWDCLDG